MEKYYKGPSTNVNKGYKTHGSFRHKGQKLGKKSVVGKEKMAKADPVHAKLRKISKAMFNKPKAMNGDVAMRSQLNA